MIKVINSIIFLLRLCYRRTFIVCLFNSLAFDFYLHCPTIISRMWWFERNRCRAWRRCKWIWSLCCLESWWDFYNWVQLSFSKIFAVIIVILIIVMLIAAGFLTIAVFGIKGTKNVSNILSFLCLTEQIRIFLARSYSRSTTDDCRRCFHSACWFKSNFFNCSWSNSWFWNNFLETDWFSHKRLLFCCALLAVR